MSRNQSCDILIYSRFEKNQAGFRKKSADVPFLRDLALKWETCGRRFMEYDNRHVRKKQGAGNAGRPFRQTAETVLAICLPGQRRRTDPAVKLVQQTCTCGIKRRFQRKKRSSGRFPALTHPENVLYWIPGTGFRSCPRHKRGRGSFINEGDFLHRRQSHAVVRVSRAAVLHSGVVLRGGSGGSVGTGDGPGQGGRRRNGGRARLMPFFFFCESEGK